VLKSEIGANKVGQSIFKEVTADMLDIQLKGVMAVYKTGGSKTSQGV
jgi:hypothetical protein